MSDDIGPSGSLGLAVDGAIPELLDKPESNIRGIAIYTLLHTRRCEEHQENFILKTRTGVVTATVLMLDHAESYLSFTCSTRR